MQVLSCPSDLIRKAQTPAAKFSESLLVRDLRKSRYDFVNVPRSGRTSLLTERVKDIRHPLDEFRTTFLFFSHDGSRVRLRLMLTPNGLASRPDTALARP